MASVNGAPADDVAAVLFEKHSPSLQRYLRFATGNADLAADLTQDVFLRVVRSADGYQPRDRDRAWLFRIARNLLLDHVRRVAARPAVAEITAEPIRAAAQTARLSIREALHRLPDRERHAFLLCEIGGLTYEELAAVLEVSPAAIRSLLYRVRLQLRATVLAPSPVANSHVLVKDHDDDI